MSKSEIIKILKNHKCSMMTNAEAMLYTSLLKIYLKSFETLQAIKPLAPIIILELQDEKKESVI